MMAMITKMLLRKYDTGNCSPEEKELVQNWLYADEPDEAIDYSLLSEEEFEVEKAAIWSQLSRNLPENKAPFYTRYRRHNVPAACLMLSLLSGAFFFAIRSLDHTQAVFTAAEDQGQLHISNHLGKTTRISGEQYEISFDGMLQLYNASTTEAIVRCGDETFILQPMVVYFLNGSDRKPALISESSLRIPTHFFRILKGDFSVKVISPVQV